MRARPNRSLSYEVSIYNMNVKDDLVSLIDPQTDDRITVNAGKTQHQGIELGIKKDLSTQLKLSVSYSYANHTYKDWVQRVASSNVDFSGNDIESAPKTIGNTRLQYYPAFLNGGQIQAEWVHLGKYWMDQSNTTEYEGHDIFNLRMNHRVNKKINTYARIMNVSDERYATAARFSRGASEFSPGLPRTYFVGMDYKF